MAKKIVCIDGEWFSMDELVARKDVSKATNGAIATKTLANLDSLGVGPKRKLKVNRKVYYPLADLQELLQTRITKQ
ncbi:MAG: hypothetical protein ABIK45_05290 [Pseudomonadota bacterium]